MVAMLVNKLTSVSFLKYPCLYILDIDDCVGLTCENNGTCVDGHNNYSCQCAPGWTGFNCSIGKQTQLSPTKPDIHRLACVTILI